ncbi:hypothetical protein [Clostridium perfringens]|nr:hypothetical protein [Clostridium perfringens]
MKILDDIFTVISILIIIIVFFIISTLNFILNIFNSIKKRK